MVAPVEERPSAEHARPPFWRNLTVVKWASQVAFLAFFVWMFWLLISQAISNLAARDLRFSWEFLGEPIGVQFFEGFNTSPETSLEALAVGMVNMMRITISGIFAATVLGTIVGVARLSSNWIVNKVANVYIETLRNIPLLVQILFWSALVTGLGRIELDQEGAGWFFSSAQGVAIPWFTPLAGRWQYTALLLLGAYAARKVYLWRVAILEREGRETNAFAWSLGAFLVFLVGGWFAHPIMGILGWVFAALAWAAGSFPVIGFQMVLAGLSAWFGYRYIKKYLDRRRTPAGLAKLTDDDYFSLILAGVVAVGLALFLLLGPGEATVASILGRELTFKMNWGLEPLFDFLVAKFDFSSGAPLRFGLPEVVVPTRFAQYSTETGKVFTFSYVAVWVGVTLYTAAFIAEIVRAGVMAVHKGQNEAAMAVGLKRGQVLRLVVLPQAFRIVLPPMGSQYLNLAKNTSLGIAVAFADIVQVGQTIFNQRGQALAVFMIWMAFYSFVSLFLSSIVNYYNRKMLLVER